MDYIGEHLLPGQLGHFFIVLALIASLVAAFAYFKATTAGPGPDGESWKKLARIAFYVDCISVAAVFSILFYIIHNHLFEYHYAWKHSSRSLEFKYLLACFWEGQEGSFLLWTIWHCVLGLILVRKAKTWEAPVMTIVSFAQFILATMIAGIYLFGYKWGANPFILLRDSGVFDNAPGMHVGMDIANPIRPDYMRSVTDGNDLNPLLQNYWMVIHPPILFLGFASALIPFAYAVAGLWTRRIGEWTRPGLPWSLFSLAALGVGIMMGAKWAYESLTFGGYWAWDPVENASLVPWLILAAGVHTVLIYKHSGHSLRSSFLFMILTFLFVLYSTFLTRSGILGEASVHAFTDLGMNPQLYLLLYLFIWPVAVIVARNRNEKLITGAAALILGLLVFFTNIAAISFITLVVGVGFVVYQIQRIVPAVVKEEAASSREFWMFIGSLVFFLSALVIIGKTSLPVFNSIFGFNLAAPEDQEFAYNQIQVFVAIILAVLTAITQYLKYKETSTKYFWKKIWLPTVIAAVIATLVLAFGNINYNQQGPGFLGAIWLAIAGSVYTIIANAAYLWIGIKGNVMRMGGSISHVGFGLVLLGILLSSSKKEILSFNTSGIAIDFGKESKEKTGENLTLVKGVPMRMGKFDVTYTGEEKHPKKELWFYNIHFKSREGKEEFTLRPNAFVNYKGNEGLMANPDSRHYLSHDIFTYVSALPNPEKNKDTATFRTNEVAIGDTIFYSKGFIILEQLNTRNNIPVEGFSPEDRGTVASLKVYSFNQTTYRSEPFMIDRAGTAIPFPDTVLSESLILRVEKLTEKGAEIGMKESGTVLNYVTLKAYKFPFINILWVGISITAIGILLSMARRIMLNSSPVRKA